MKTPKQPAEIEKSNIIMAGEIALQTLLKTTA